VPVRPLNNCKFPGCAKGATGEYCDEHKTKTESAVRKRTRRNPHNHLYGRKWKKRSKQYLKKNPLCVHCLERGETVAAEMVDHIEPHKGDLLLFWLVSNWQGLCLSCHSTKTVLFDGGFGRPRRVGAGKK